MKKRVTKFEWQPNGRKNSQQIKTQGGGALSSYQVELEFFSRVIPRGVYGATVMLHSNGRLADITDYNLICTKIENIIFCIVVSSCLLYLYFVRLE